MTIQTPLAHMARLRPYIHADAEGSPKGLRHVAVLVTAKDGDTTLDTKAAGFTVA
ncbi:hypothetical protein ACFY0F_09065 [Streptomyces sp. NPDC001544]|uniref:hypothetical protein n=1 Tax=Streptomyces sp. NPDC001544 TaxID=3364584 RepID=UPI0036A02A9C